MALETANGVEFPPVLGDEGDEITNGAAPKGSKKRLSVERIYQKKTQLEHILLRPDTYIGSVEKVTQPMWVMDNEAGRMVNREITFVPGLYKIFDEILVNAADNKQRDPTMDMIRIDIKPEENLIRIWNNGKGIPVVEHRDEKMFVPTMIFGHLLTSSNYDDTERKVTGGRNGYGAKLCNIFSDKFIIETSCKEYKKALKQTWINNMTKTSEPKIYPAESSDFTCVTFYPDLKKFKMDHFEEDTFALFTRRAYDLAATCRGVKIVLNGKRLPVKNFKEYVELYLKDATDDFGKSLKVVHEIANPRWEVAVALSSTGFQQVSFVNSIATTKGGRHVDHVSEQIINKLMEIVKKKAGNKSGVNVKKFQIQSHMWVFVNCLIENPSFDSQTKEMMTLQVKNFGSKCALSEVFVKNTSKCGIVESILNWVKFKAMEKMEQQCHKSKRSKLKGIPKLDDANLAGTKDSRRCTLILTEGDSAKALAVAGLGVVGRDCYGVFPLRGKLLNVRDASSKQVMENAEINNMIKILGLQYKNDYKSVESLATLRYGKVMIMTDQDQDGSHIKGLIINFLHHNWPNLIRHKFVEEFITPIVKVFKNKTELSFYSLPEFEEWKKATQNWHTWRVKYYKGLGTSSSKEAKDYFSDMLRHRIQFKYEGEEDDSALVLAFGKKADERKEWLSSWMDERKRRLEIGLPEQYLYGKDTRVISYHDFVNKELILFSNLDNERSIPCLVDGLKPGQRKVLFACFKRNQVREIKVAQLAGAVSELSAYHHGETSLAGTIVGLAQNFVGSNNINLLMPHGQFGTRLHGGKDAASPRYIFTCLSPLARHIFNANDEQMLKYNYDDNLRVEPEWYIPIIPMVLINGADGIGTGWACKVPNFDPMDIITNLRRLMRGEEMRPMLPSFSGFNGTIQQLDSNRYVVSGVVSVLEDSNQVEITELPVRVWTQNYKESVIESMLTGSDKVQPVLQDYKEYHTDKTVKFVVRMSHEKLLEAEAVGLHKYFKLSNTLNTNQMVLFDENGCVRRYSSAMEIIKDFYTLRLKWYDKRKQYMEGMLSAECLKLENQARFVLEKIQGQVSIENRAKRALIKLLEDKSYDSDPVKKWKATLALLSNIEESAEAEGAESGDEEKEKESSDFNYILNMPLWSLTLEKKEALLKERDKKKQELQTLRAKSNKDLWNEDLDALVEEMEKQAALEKKEDEDAMRKARLQKMKSAVTVGKGMRQARGDGAHRNEFLPSPNGRRVEPRISDFVMKVEAEKRKKQKREEKAVAAADKVAMVGSDDEDIPLRLSERLEMSGTNLYEGLKPDPPKRKLHIMTVGESSRGRGRGRGRGGGGGATRPAKKASDAADGKAAAKKGKKKKKNAFDSDSEESSLSDFGETVSPTRANIPRRQTAAAPKKYNFDSEDESSDEEIFRNIDHGQGDGELKIAKASDSDSGGEPAPRPEKMDSDDSLSSIGQLPPATKPAPAASKRGGGATRGATRGGGGGTAVRGRGRGRGGAAGGGTAKSRPKKDLLDSDLSDGDSDSPFPKKKKAPAKSKPKPKPKAKAKDPFGSGSSGDESGAVAASPVRERLGRAATSARPQYVFDDSDDEDDSDVGLKLATAATKKRRKDSDDSDFDFTAESKKRKAVFGDSDDDF